MGQGHVDHYDDIRLNSTIGYITPKDMVAGHQQRAAWQLERITSGWPTIRESLTVSAFIGSNLPTWKHYFRLALTSIGT